MLSLTATPTASSLSSPLKLLRRNPNPRYPRVHCSSTSTLNSGPNPNPQPVRANHAGVRFEGIVDVGSAKARIDSWIASRMQGVSRSRIESSIRSGLVAVNGRTVQKVVHPAPGNANGTLVNAVLNHCRLPTAACTDNKRCIESEECIDSSDNEIEDFPIDQSIEEFSSDNNDALVRPGIVHRLDKGTSGLLVIAKDEHSHSHLAEQFKNHIIHRVYISLTSGVPRPDSGRIEVPIARDSSNRIRMAAVPGLKNSKHARYAASIK